jgi:DNA replication protein DnaC
MFAVVPDLLDHLRASFAPGREGSYDDLFERVRRSDLLVLDDLGAQATSPWAQEKLFQVVNFRTVSELATVITSDRERDQLVAALPRIAARAFDPRVGTVINIMAPHYSLGRPAEPRARRQGVRG